ncbi:15358_t:CDS:1, partial [Funneliformis mosseae]
LKLDPEGLKFPKLKIPDQAWIDDLPKDDENKVVPTKVSLVAVKAQFRKGCQSEKKYL